MKKRILFDLILLVLAFCVPWWLTLVLVAVGTFKFPFYGEAVLFGVLIDLLYGTVTSYGFGLAGFILALGIFATMFRFRDAVRPAYRG